MHILSFGKKLIRFLVRKARYEEWTIEQEEAGVEDFSSPPQIKTTQGHSYDDYDDLMRKFDPDFRSGAGGVIPKAVRRRYQLAIASWRCRHWEAAVSHFRVLLDSEYYCAAEKACFLHSLACIPLLYGAMEWLDRAEDWSRQACRLAPQAALPRCTLGCVLAEKGRLGQALELLEPCASSDDVNQVFLVHAYLAKIHSRLGQLNQAENHLVRALSALRAGGNSMLSFQAVFDRIEREIRNHR